MRQNYGYKKNTNSVCKECSKKKKNCKEAQKVISWDKERREYVAFCNEYKTDRQK